MGSRTRVMKEYIISQNAWQLGHYFYTTDYKYYMNATLYRTLATMASTSTECFK